MEFCHSWCIVPLAGSRFIAFQHPVGQSEKKTLGGCHNVPVCMRTLDQIELLSLTWMPSLFPPITTICYSQTIPRSRCPISCSPLLGTEYFILFPPKDLLSMPMLDICLQTNWQLPKLNLNVWIKWKLSGNLPVPGLHRCTWCQRPLGDGVRVGTYRRLNDVTIPDRYPVPNIQDFSANLTGMRVFSKIDLVQGYHQIPVAKADIPKTAIITPFGVFKFLRMPFGLKMQPRLSSAWWTLSVRDWISHSLI